MRKLVWFALGVALMCAAIAYLPVRIALALCIPTAICGIVSFILRYKEKLLRILSILCAGVLSGAVLCGVCFRTVQQPAQQLSGKEYSLSARIDDYSFVTEGGGAAVARITVDGRNYSVQLYFRPYIDLKPGDTVSGIFTLRYTGGENGTYHFGNGIYLLGYQNGTVLHTPADKVPADLYPAVLRRQMLDSIDRCFPEDTAFFAKALLLGDRSGMDYEYNTAFAATGVSHIIAVSGMHVSILASVVYFLTGRRRLLMSLIGIPAVFLFAAVAGFTPSVTRACTMQILLLLAVLLRRDYDPLTALAVAALIMLAEEPAVITSVSFQLSFGCMAGIFLFSSRIYSGVNGWRGWADRKDRSPVGRIRKWFSGSIGITFGSMFFTTPLCALYFGSVSLIGVITNLMVLGAVSLIFGGVALVCLLATFHIPLARIIASVISWPVRWLLAFLCRLAEFPMSAVYTESPYILIWLGLCYGVILLYIAMKGKRGGLLLCGCVLSLCVCLMFSWVRPNTGRMQLSVLDVGQGQSVIISAGGRHFLVDCGGDYDEGAADKAAQSLLSRGIFSLDGVILTHYDRDHAGGMAYLLSRVPTDTVYLPSREENSYHNAIAEKGNGSLYYVERDIRLQWEDCSMDIFAPVLSYSDNESGICVLFQSEKCDILITGDLNTVGEAMLISQKNLPDIDVLVVGHHGSRHSTGQALLEATRPEFALISVGADNTYGHPSQEVLDRLRDFGCTVWRTDEMGDLEIRR